MMGNRIGSWVSGYWGLYGWIMFGIMVLLVVGVIFLIVFLIRRGIGRGKLYMDPLEELKASYIRGEIDREEYLRMKKDLMD